MLLSAQAISSLFSKLTESFSLSLSAWGKARHVLVTILVASFIINLLSLVFPLALLQIYDRIIPNVAMHTLVLLALGVIVALTLETLLRIARSYVGAWADAKFEHTTGCQAFSRVLSSSLSRFQREGAGQHLKQLNALFQLRDFYSGQAVISMADLPFIVLLLLLIAYIGTWVVFIPITMLGVFTYMTLQHNRDMETVLADKKLQDERRMNYVIETITHIHTVKSLAMEAQMLRRYERLQRVSSVHDFDVITKGSNATLLGMTVAQLTVVLVVSLGSLMVIKGMLTVGGLAACTLLSGRCLQPVSNIMRLWARLKSIQMARAELMQVLELPQETQKDAPKIKIVRGDIRFEDVTFGHEHQHPLLERANFTVQAKQVIGISGDGLSGKTTLLWLMMGLLKPSAGKILIDDKDIANVDLHSLREQIAYLPQQGVIFRGTIMDNLTMFDKRYAERAKNIAKQLGLANIVDNLPSGYDTEVGGQAVDALPRGISQRMTLVRALVREAPIVLFDEANAGIDLHGDAEIKQCLEQLVGKCTLILISHRPSVLALASVRYTLSQGQLVTIND